VEGNQLGMVERECGRIVRTESMAHGESDAQRVTTNTNVGQGKLLVNSRGIDVRSEDLSGQSLLVKVF
jgi:hypothetical protein